MDCVHADGVCKRCGRPLRSEATLRNCTPGREAYRPGFAGTELKKLLAGWPFYLTSTPDCSCNARAAEMDRQGVEWCGDNIDTIVGWLREQAQARGLPFLDAAGRMLVRRAIRNARKLR